MAVAALSMLLLLVVVSSLVVRWCPRGVDCKEASQILFGLGTIVSLTVSIALGFLARDLADRFAAKDPR